MEKQKVIYTQVEQNSVLKRKEIQAHGTTQIKHEDTVPREINQSQNDKYCLTPLTYCTWNTQIHRQKTECCFQKLGGARKEEFKLEKIKRF